MTKTALEIERKFLVKDETFKEEARNCFRIIQGFLNRDPDRTVRVRIRNNKGFLTVKSKSTNDGIARFEWEKELTKNEAKALLEFCEEGVIEKLRYEIPSGKHIFEVDCFFGANEGLIVAEVELSDENEEFIKPKWLGEEVTGSKQYYNSQLSIKPYSKWEN
ncbi:MAG: CYTH domain-containing protein [bacterium]